MEKKEKSGEEGQHSITEKKPPPADKETEKLRLRPKPESPGTKNREHNWP